MNKYYLVYGLVCLFIKKATISVSMRIFSISRSRISDGHHVRIGYELILILDLQLVLGLKSRIRIIFRLGKK